MKLRMLQHPSPAWRSGSLLRTSWRVVGATCVLAGMAILCFLPSAFAPTLAPPAAFPPVLPSGEEPAVAQAVPAESTSTVAIVDAKAPGRLVIPKIGVDMPVYTGDISVLNRGAWLLPRTSAPDKGGNTVLSAHRWLYRPPDPRTFYNLDKLTSGDMVYVTWHGMPYTYEVTGSKVVTPDHVEILYPTKNPILTLFTCTPLFSTSHRLVVTAKLVRE